MKKLIVLLIILAMVNVANAGIIDIMIASLNGQPIDPHVDEITVVPTDEIDLAITWTAPPTEYLFGLGVTINIDGPATLLPLDNVGYHADYDPYLHAVGDDWIVEGASWLGPQGADEPIDVVWDILVHCDGPGDVIIWLTQDPLESMYPTDEEWNPVDWEFSPAITIHQIPEPMTLTLLGLGGLVLLRRRK